MLVIKFFQSPKFIYILANSVDPDEMTLSVALHLGFAICERTQLWEIVFVLGQMKKALKILGRVRTHIF